MSMGNSYLPNKDADLDDWLQNFNTVASANVNALPITQLEINASDDATTDFTSGRNQVVTAHAAAKSATMQKDTARKTAVATVRALVKKIQADAAVPDSLKLTLGITIPVPRPKPIPVFAPAKAVASILAGGIVQLAWDVNGNASGTIYVIEAATSSPQNWQQANIQTASRFLDNSASLGTTIYYRIKAQRATRTSDYSNVAMVVPK